MISLVQSYFILIVFGFLFVTGMLMQQFAGWIEVEATRPEVIQISQLFASDDYPWQWIPKSLEQLSFNLLQFLALPGLTSFSVRRINRTPTP